MIRLSAIRRYALDPGMYDMVFVNQIMDTKGVNVSFEDDLQSVLDLMDLHNLDHVPVVENLRFAGMISKGRILDLYRRELIMQTHIQ